MNSLLDGDTEDDLDDRPARGAYGKDREITLGTTMVLGIFFALAAYGAVLFGFGYSMGAKHTTASAATEAATSTTNFSAFKPASGLPMNAAGRPQPAGPTVTVPLNGTDAPLTTVVPPPRLPPAPRTPAPSPDQAQTVAATTPVQPPTSTVQPPTPRPAAPAPAAAAAASPPGPTGAFLVQVAAVSHQEDADLLVTTLKRRGYPVAIRHEPQDALLHVQIGNFPTRKDAEATRQRLLADGFNAIVK